MEPMKNEPESPHSLEFQRFDATIGKLLAIPRDVYQARLAAWKENPGSRGRLKRRKVTQPAAPSSRGPAE